MITDPANNLAATTGPPWPTVIVPVYNAFDHLSQCLQSLHETSPSGSNVLLIDDASTDERVMPLLKAWTGKSGISWSLLEHRQNRGFVQTANHGMQATSGDVVLLNTDTVVTPGWIQGLARCLSSDERIATATPWTNNGEIASLPLFCRPNPVPPSVNEIAAIIRQVTVNRYPDIPTAVGFCMAVSRRAIDTLGTFDADTFGLGYGEENDFSQRAIKAGMRNVLCTDVYVAHVGGQSFLPRGFKPDDVAMKKLLTKHPDYLQQVQAFIAADPLRGLRQQLVSALDQAGISMR